MAKDRTQENPLVRVTPARDTSFHDEALRGSRRTEDPLYWDDLARAAARKFGVDEELAPRDRAMAIARKIGNLAVSMRMGGGPNLRYMNGLLDAVESGNAKAWRKHPISDEEIAAARRATGRSKLPMREPGCDDE